MSELSDLKVGDEVGYYEYGRFQYAERVTRITAKYVEVGGRLYGKDLGRLRGNRRWDSNIGPLTPKDREALALRDVLKDIAYIMSCISERVRVLENLGVAQDVRSQLQSILDGLWPKEREE